MTRKQALLQAIELLQDNKELTEKLAEICDEYPNCTWTRKSALDAFDEYVREHNAIPLTRELGKGKFPSNTYLLKEFGMTPIQFCEKYYKKYVDSCATVFYRNHSKEYWINDFKEQYSKLKCSARKYDQQRRKGSPSERTIRVMLGCKTWHELLEKTGFKSNIKQNSLYCSKSVREIRDIKEQLEIIIGDTRRKTK